jgi:hypothetical protein
MKKLSIILCALCLLGVAWWAQARTVMVVTGGTPAAAASTEYFGNTTTSGCSDNALSANYVKAGIANSGLFQSTKSGTVVSIEVWMKKGAGSAGNIRLALYQGNTLVCQGGAQASVSSATYGWVGHTSSLSGTCTIATSTDYRVALSSDSAENTNCSDTVTSGDYGYDSDNAAYDYTDIGFPASFSGIAANNSSTSFHYRIGVQ